MSLLLRMLSLGSEKVASSESGFQQFDEGLADPRRRRRDANAGVLHRLDLGFRISRAAGDDGARMSHAAPGGSGSPGDEADRRLTAAAPGFALQEAGRLLLARTA